MIRAIYTIAAVAIAMGASVAIVGACGSGGTATPTASDAQGTTDAGDETDAPPAGPPSAPRLLVGSQASLWAITAKDDVVFSDVDGLHAIPLAGGAGTDIVLPGLSSPDYGIRSDGDFLTFIGSGPPMSKGTLSLWSKARGTSTAPGSVRAGRTTIDPTGTYILFTRAGALDTMTVVVAPVDFSSEKILVSDVYLNPAMEWLGPNGDTAIITFGRTDVDAGTDRYTIAAFSGASWSRRDLSSDFTNTQQLPWWLPEHAVDPRGGRVAAITSTGDLMVLPSDGSAPSRIDSGAAKMGYFLRDGRIVYATGAELRASPADVPSPQTLAAVHVTTFAGLSDDERWLSFDASPSGGGDVHVASTTTPGAPVAVGSYGVINGITTDSAYAFALASYDNATFAGTLMSVPIAGGSARTVASSVSAGELWRLRGSGLVFVDDTTVDAGFLAGNLEWIDLGSPDPPTRLVTSSDFQVLVSADRHHVVYYDDGGADGAGVYVVDFP